MGDCGVECLIKELFFSHCPFNLNTEVNTCKQIAELLQGGKKKKKSRQDTTMEDLQLKA